MVVPTWLIWAGSIFKTVRHRDVSNLAKFHAFIKKESNSTIFWSLAARLKQLNIAENWTSTTKWLTGVKWRCLETILSIYHKKIHLYSSPLASSHGNRRLRLAGNKSDVITSIRQTVEDQKCNSYIIGLTELFKYRQICTLLWKIIAKFASTLKRRVTITITITIITVYSHNICTVVARLWRSSYM